MKLNRQKKLKAFGTNLKRPSRSIIPKSFKFDAPLFRIYTDCQSKKKQKRLNAEMFSRFFRKIDILRFTGLFHLLKICLHHFPMPDKIKYIQIFFSFISKFSQNNKTRKVPICSIQKNLPC